MLPVGWPMLYNFFPAHHTALVPLFAPAAAEPGGWRTFKIFWWPVQCAHFHMAYAHCRQRRAWRQGHGPTVRRVRQTCQMLILVASCWTLRHPCPCQVCTRPWLGRDVAGLVVQNGCAAAGGAWWLCCNGWCTLAGALPVVLAACDAVAGAQ